MIKSYEVLRVEEPIPYEEIEGEREFWARRPGALEEMMHGSPGAISHLFDGLGVVTLPVPPAPGTLIAISCTYNPGAMVNRHQRRLAQHRARQAAKKRDK